MIENLSRPANHPMASSVNCTIHGPQPETFVCQHIVASLTTGEPVGFWWSTQNPENSQPDAWCTECNERVGGAGGEWTPEAEAFAGIRLLCGRCYDRARELALGPREG